MSYNSKKTIASMLAGVGLIIAYIIYARGGSAPAPSDLKAWAVAMLIFIGIGVAVEIVIQIIFHIALAIGVAIKEQKQDEKTIERIISSTVTEDERDKLIGLKSANVGYAFAGMGFVAALIALAAGATILVAVHITFGSFCIGSIVEGGISIYHYERGVHNG